jgi:hypothetical protein
VQINISRRNLLKLGIYSAVGMNLAQLSMLNGCATLSMEAYKEPTPVHYPRLPEKKIQSPEHYGLEGCYVGGYRMTNKYYYSKTKQALSIAYVESIYEIKELHSRYRKVMGIDENEKLEKATIPYLYYDLKNWVSNMLKMRENLVKSMGVFSYKPYTR